MDVQEARIEFIKAWEQLSFSWGVSKSMAAVHALLLGSSQPLSANDIREALDSSIGSVHKNLHELLDWNLIYKSKMADRRKDYFTAEKDMWTVFRRIAKKRKSKELEPLLQVLDKLLVVEGEDHETREFKEMLKDLKQFSCSADSALQGLIRSESNWIVNTWMHIANNNR